MEATLSNPKRKNPFIVSIVHALADALRFQAHCLSKPAAVRDARDFEYGFHPDSRYQDLTSRRDTFELYRLLAGHDNPV